MPKMIPRRYDLDNPSPGEKIFFEKIAQDNSIDDWVVLHSLNIAHHEKRIMGEIDFLIIIPNLGVLAVEIKAHTHIEVKDGRWYMGRSDRKGSLRSPFEQLNDSLFSLKSYISKKSNILKHIPIFPLVIFTHFEFTTKSVEWNHKQIISSKEFRSRLLSQLLIKRIKIARKELLTKNSNQWFKLNQDRPTSDDVIKLINLLRPSIEPLKSSTLIQTEIENELKRFTVEQYSALDALEDNPNVIFNGAAGTGKTFIAMESAIRTAVTGKKVLLVCMNRFLYDLLKYKLKEYDITVTTLHALMRKYDTSPVINSSEYWESELPQIAYLKMLEVLEEEDLFDLLVVDEAQDIVKNHSWVDCLDILVKKGFTQGNVHLFGDFTYQSIYSREITDKELMSDLMRRNPTAVTYKLKKNCRNLEPSAQLSFSLSDMSSPYSNYLRKSAPIINSQYQMYSNDIEQLKILKTIIKRCLEAGFNKANIVILSMVAETKSLAHKNCDILDAISYKHNSNKLCYTSIHKFKGLEAPVVILTDFNDIQSDESRKMLFTGASRATDSVHYLFHDSVKKSLISLLKKGKK